MFEMKWSHLRLAVACLPVLACIVLLAGCPIPPTPTPPAAAVLEGDWTTQTEDGGVAFVRFNDVGVVVGLFAVNAEGATITLDIDDGTTTLTGSAVTVRVPTDQGEVVFEGTLSADQNTMTGSLTQAIVIESGLITVPAGDITLVRVECETDADCPEGEICENGLCVEETGPGPADTFPTSFHGAREGKRDFYEAEDGFVTLTGIPYDDLPCKNCHAAALADGTPVDNETYVPSCADCHADVEDPTSEVADSICLGCHGRQGAEQNLFSSVHREAGMGCMDCHTDREMHGDGTEYGSFLSPGAMDADCDNCHVEGGSAVPPSATNMFHTLHGDALHCSACHVASVSSCYNCHFESEVAHTGKRFFGQAPRTGFKMLMNYEGKVHTATFQTLSHEGQTFLTIAPFFGHSVTKEGIMCDDCHGNAAVTEYNDTGQIVVTRWDPEAEGTDRLIGPTGVIPIPPDWETALQFDFLDYTGEATDPINRDDNLPLWDFLKTGADGQHAPFGEPLTVDQMNALE